MASNCSCASFYNVTSGSGLVVTESGGACVLSDSREPWCIVNLTTCQQPTLLHESHGQPWDYCARPAHASACGEGACALDKLTVQRAWPLTPKRW